MVLYYIDFLNYTLSMTKNCEKISNLNISELTMNNLHDESSIWSKKYVNIPPNANFDH